MKRLCSCGRLSAYSRDGRVPVPEAIAGCLTVEEMKGVIAVLSREMLHRSRGGTDRPVHDMA